MSTCVDEEEIDLDQTPGDVGKPDDQSGAKQSEPGDPAAPENIPANNPTGEDLGGDGDNKPGVSNTTSSEQANPEKDAGTGGEQPELTPEEEEEVNRLTNQWSDRLVVDLGFRHAWGQRLIEVLGAPGTNQPRGAQVIKKLAARCHISEPVVRQIRLFAYRHPDFEKFKKDHPDVKSWRKARELDGIKDTDPDSASASSNSTDQAKTVFDKVLRQIKAASTTMNNAEDIFPVEEKQNFDDAVKNLISAIWNYGGIKIEIVGGANPKTSEEESRAAA